MIKSIFYTCSALALCAAAPALAQQSASAEANAHDGEILVTARKRAESVQDVPVAVSAFNDEMLAERNVEQIQDLQRVSPGVSVTQNTRSATGVRFIIRGLAPADSLLATDPSAAIYLNEVYVPRDYGLKVGMFDLERVEVLKGPQGTLYGRNSTGGAIGMFTRKPDLDEASGYAQFEFGKYGTGKAEGALNLPLVNDVLATRLAFNVGTTNGYTFGNNGRHLGDQTSLALRGSLAYKPTDTLRFDAVVSHTRVTGPTLYFRTLEVIPGFQPGDEATARALGLPAGPTNPCVTGVGGPATFVTCPSAQLGQDYLTGQMNAQGRFTNNDEQGTPEVFRGTKVSFVASWDMTDDLMLKSITGYEKFYRYQTTDLDATPLPIGTVYQRTDDKFFSQELQLSGKAFGDFAQFVLGGYYGNETGTEYAASRVVNQLAGGRVTIQDADVRNKTLGAYFQSDFKITDRFTLTGGLRYTEDRRGVTFRHRNETPAGAIPVCQILASLITNGAACTPSSVAGPFAEARVPTLSFNRVNYTVAAAYKVTDEVNLYATARSGYRSGGYNIFTAITAGVSSFKPDSVKDVEIGVKTELFDRKLRFNIAAFQSKYSDIQKATLTITSTGTSIRALRNAARATVKGFEADFSARPVDGLTLDGFVSYTDAGYDEFLERNAAGVVTADRTSEPFDTPKWTYGLGAGYVFSIGLGQINTRVDWYWRGNSIFTATNQLLPTEQVLRQKSYGLLGGRIAWELPEDFSIAVVGRNLLNKDYLVGGTDLRGSLGISTGFPGEPRYIGVQLKKVFGGG